jgi:hypothetical protein
MSGTTNVGYMTTLIPLHHQETTNAGTGATLTHPTPLRGVPNVGSGTARGVEPSSCIALVQ